MTTVTTSDIDSDYFTVDQLIGKCDQANQYTYCDHHNPITKELRFYCIYIPIANELVKMLLHVYYIIKSMVAMTVGHPFFEGYI